MVPGKSQHRRSLLLTSLVCTALVLGLHVWSGLYRDFEWSWRDKLARFGKKAPVNPEIVFLAIDNASSTLDSAWKDEIDGSRALQMMNAGFPYSRAFYPLVIERLMKAGAKTVAFDMLFPTPKPEDPPFREALERYADKVVIGGNYEKRDQGAPTDDERLSHTSVAPSTTLIPAARGFDGRVGFVNFWPDSDDAVVRRALYSTTTMELQGESPGEGDAEFFSLSSRILQKSGHADRIPPGHQMKMFRFTSYVRPYSLYTIFVPRLWETPPFNNGEFFRDKIVLIGPSGNWAKDELLTPLGLTGGPSIHLSALNAALTGDFLIEPSAWANVLLILVGGAIAWALGRFLHAPMWRFLLLAGLAVGFYGLVQLLFNRIGLFPIVLSPLLALVSSGATFSITEQVLERLEKAKLRRNFERYVSRDVVKELVDNPGTFLNTLTGVRKNISILFSDVRGFTTLTESADAAQLVAQLNEYFTEMVRIVFEHNGTLDKFIGDAVMAHWGSIDTKGEQVDAQRAVSTALHMSRALVKLNEDWKNRGMMEIHFGIGINHGSAIVGNLGSAEKQEFTAIGDPVNVASRLEGATKQFHVEFLIGEGVAPLVCDAFIVRTVGLLQVKGKTRPLEVFTVLKERAPGEAPPEWLAHYEKGMTLYRTRNFAGAVDSFSQAITLQPGDWLNEEYLRGSQAFLENPPAADWDGVLIMTTK